MIRVDIRRDLKRTVLGKVTFKSNLGLAETEKTIINNTPQYIQNIIVLKGLVQSKMPCFKPFLLNRKVDILKNAQSIDFHCFSVSVSVDHWIFG